MSNLDKLHNKIKEQYVGTTGKCVLLVEGEHDVLPFKAWLRSIDTSWENRWDIAPAGKKSNVLELLELEPDWIGVVDRDEWTVQIIAEKQRESPNLWVLPRFCLENYLCDPDELWAMLPEVQQQKIQGGSQALDAAITVDLHQWLQHGALWHVINPLWEGLRALGFKEWLLDIRQAGNDQAIQQTLNDWHQFLEPTVIWADYQARLAEVTGWQVSQQLKSGVHGKTFFREVISNELNRLLRKQAKANDRKKDLLLNSEPPADLQPLWRLMGLI